MEVIHHLRTLSIVEYFIITMHDGMITDGMVFHCFACNLNVCASCMEEECIFCNCNISKHKNILIFINQFSLLF